MVSTISSVVSRFLKSSGFSFQPDFTEVTLDLSQLLKETQDIVEDFAKDEDFAKHIVDCYKRNNNEAIRALDSKRVNDLGSNLWQTKDWYYNLAKKVPYLILELAKFEGPSAKLAKIHDFYRKPFKWSPKTNPQLEVAEKYLSVLKLVRDQLHTLQESVSNLNTKGIESTKVGKFELFGEASPKAVEVLKKSSKAMSSLGLGVHCYGKVTLVGTSKLSKGSSAFYVKNTDEIFLSPEVQGDQDVRALCHEIAHRVYVKLNLKHKGESLYEDTKDKGSWVTSYAKTNPEENFCEMVSFAALKKLPEEGVSLLKVLIPTLST